MVNAEARAREGTAAESGVGQRFEKVAADDPEQIDLTISDEGPMAVAFAFSSAASFGTSQPRFSLRPRSMRPACCQLPIACL